MVCHEPAKEAKSVYGYMFWSFYKLWATPMWLKKTW